MDPKRRQRLQAALASLEREFDAKLILALRRCAAGNWGLFAQNESLLPDHLRTRAYEDSGARELDALGAEIEQTRQALGIPGPFEPYLRLQANRGRKTENDLGETRLALSWLEELGS